MAYFQPRKQNDDASLMNNLDNLIMIQIHQYAWAVTEHYSVRQNTTADVSRVFNLTTAIRSVAVFRHTHTLYIVTQQRLTVNATCTFGTNASCKHN